MARKARISAAVISLMEAGTRHAWTLDELHADLARRGSATDFSSVFRAAEKLVAAGAVRKLLIEDGRTRFELSAAHHDHLYCTRCHGIEPVPCLVQHGGFRDIERRTGAAIIEHQLILNGICRNCRRTGKVRRGKA